MEKEKKKQKNVNDHDKKAKSAKALHVSKCKQKIISRKPISSFRMILQEMENCQFSVICESLRTVGIDRSEEIAREEIVEYLENHPHLQNFTTVEGPTYIENMAQDGTYRDHLTVLFKLQQTFISTIHCYLLIWALGKGHYIITTVPPSW